MMQPEDESKVSQRQESLSPSFSLIRALQPYSQDGVWDRDLGIPEIANNIQLLEPFEVGSIAKKIMDACGANGPGYLVRGEIVDPLSEGQLYYWTFMSQTSYERNPPQVFANRAGNAYQPTEEVIFVDTTTLSEEKKLQNRVRRWFSSTSFIDAVESYALDGYMTIVNGFYPSQQQRNRRTAAQLIFRKSFRILFANTR